jgi:hypothetical protein
MPNLPRTKATIIHVTSYNYHQIWPMHLIAVQYATQKQENEIYESSRLSAVTYAKTFPGEEDRSNSNTGEAVKSERDSSKTVEVEEEEVLVGQPIYSEGVGVQGVVRGIIYRLD